MNKNDNNKEIFTEDEVKHVALLARLQLDEQQVSIFQKQLSRILEYIVQLNEVDTKDTLPTSHALSSMKNVFREDELKESLPLEDVLKNAPSKHGNFFEVPKIIKDA